MSGDGSLADLPFLSRHAGIVLLDQLGIGFLGLNTARNPLDSIGNFNWNFFLQKVGRQILLPSSLRCHFFVVVPYFLTLLLD